MAECAPITTDYIWRARDRGAKLIYIDPRMVPMARTADLHIPVRPGGDAALMNGILHVCIERGWVDQQFIDEHTTGFEDVKAAVAKYTPEVAGEMSGVDPALIVRAAEMWGPAKTSFLLHARGIEHHTKGVDNVLSCINLVLATGRIGRARLRLRHHHRAGQRPGRPRARPQMRPASRQPRHHEPGASRSYIADVWGIAESEMPGKGLTAQEIIEAMHAGEIKGLLSICFNPVVSLPDASFTKEAFNRLEHYSVIDFFLSPRRRATPTSCCPARSRRRTRAPPPPPRGA